MSISSRRVTVPFACALVSFLLVTCSDGPTDPPGPDRTPVSLLASHDSLVLAVGDSAMAWFEVRDAQAALVVPTGATWNALDPAVATVANGKVRAVSAGTARVTIALGALADTLTVRALAPIDATALVVASATLQALGARTTLQATSLAAGQAREGRYTIISRTVPVVAVEDPQSWGTATLRAVAAGEAWVVASEHGGTADSVLVSVRPALARFSFSTETVTGYQGRTISPSITGTDVNGNSFTSTDFTLHVLDSSIALPGPNATLELLKEGFTRVEAVSAVGGRTYAEVIVRPYPTLTASLLTGGVDFPVARIGTGQLATGPVSADGPMYEQTLTATVIGDPAVAAIASLTPSGQVTYTGLQTGDSRVIIASPRMRPDTISVHVTASRIHVDEPLPVIGVGVTRTPIAFVSDSAGLWRERLEDVTVTITSSDSTVLRVEPASRTIVFDRRSDNGRGFQLTGLAPGMARITISGPGLVSREIDYTVTTGKHLLVTPSSATMGANQTTARAVAAFGAPWRIRASDRSADVVVSFSHSNPSVASTPAQVTLTPLHLWLEFDVETLAPGVDTIVASASGFVPDTVVLTVTSPRFAPMNQAPVAYQFGPSGVIIGVGDTLGIQQGPRASIGVYGESSDSSVVLPGATTLPERWRAPWGLPLTLRDTGLATITIRDSAGVIPPMNLPLRVAPSPWLSVTSDDVTDLAAIGAGQRFQRSALALVAPFTAPADLDVEVTSTNQVALPLNTVLTMAQGQNGLIIPLPVPPAVGSARIVVKAKGFVPDTSVTIDVGVPQFEFVRFPSTLVSGQQDTVTVRLTDHRGRVRVTDSPITLELSAVGAVLSDAVQTTIPAGASLSAKMPVTLNGSGPARLVVSHVSGGPVVYGPDTVVMRLAFAGRTVTFATPAATIGVGQRIEVNASRSGFSAGETTDFAVASLRGRGMAATPVSFGGSSSTQPVTIVGTQPGVDTLTIAAAGYAGDSLRVVVTEGRLRLTGLPASGPAGTSYTVTLSTLDSTGAARAVNATTQFAIGSSDGVSITAVDGASLTSITVAEGSSTSAPFVVRATASGPKAVVVSKQGYVQLQALFSASQ